MSWTQYVFLAFVVLVILSVATQWRRVRAGGQSAKRFLREVKVEMQKVSWPSQNDLIGSTIAVLTVVVILMVIIMISDNVLGRVMDLLLSGRGI